MRAFRYYVDCRAFDVTACERVRLRACAFDPTSFRNTIKYRLSSRIVIYGYPKGIFHWRAISSTLVNFFRFRRRLYCVGNGVLRACACRREPSPVLLFYGILTVRFNLTFPKRRNARRPGRRALRKRLGRVAACAPLSPVSPLRSRFRTIMMCRAEKFL